MNPFLFFNMNADGSERVYSTDGTAGGTVDLQLSRFKLAMSESFLDNPKLAGAVVSFAGKTFFVGFADDGPSRLFVTDGTIAGSAPVANGPTGVYSVYVIGSRLVTWGPAENGDDTFYSSRDGVHFDPIESDLNIVSVTSTPGLGFLTVGSQDSGRLTLWRTDGTASGTYNITPAGQTLIAGSFIPVAGGRTVFTNYEADNSSTLWVTDGSLKGTYQIARQDFATGRTNPFSGVSAGGKAIFSAIDRAGNFALWSSDGSSAGTVELKNFGPAELYSEAGPSDLTAWDARTVFSVAGEAWITDGTAKGTLDLGVFGTDFAALGSRILIGSESGPLYVSDGTPKGTRPLEIPGLNYIVAPLGGPDFTVIGNQAVFTGVDVTGKENFYSTDGTQGGTKELSLPPGVALGRENPTVVEILGAPRPVILGGGAQFYDAPVGVSVQAGNGSDTITATAGNVTVTGGSGHLFFSGGSGPSSVSGGAGSATVYGGSGGGNFQGGKAGHDWLVSQGASGANSTLTGAGAGDVLVGSRSGTDLLIAGAHAETILGGNGPTTIEAGSGQDFISIGSGTTSLVGGAGAMRVALGAGKATIDEGSGAAAYTVAKRVAGGADVLNGYRPATDHIELSGYQPAEVKRHTVGGSTLISLSDGTTIRIVGVTDLGHSLSI